MNDTALVIGSVTKSHIDKKDWSKQSLRTCLHVLGVTDQEMRFKRGVRGIMECWKKDAQVLLDLVKKKWKAQVVVHHEANGGDPEEWKNLNCLYSVIAKRIAPYIPKIAARKIKFITFDCVICLGTFTKKYVSRFQDKSCLCGKRECYLKNRSIRGKMLRMRYQGTEEVICENPECRKRFFPIGKARGKTRFCSPKCRRKVWAKKNADLLRKWDKSYKTKRPWKVRFSEKTEEQKEEYRMRRADKTHALIDRETPEHKKARLAKIKVRMQKYRDKRKAEGNPVKRTNRLEWLEKKKIELIDKPWIYETYVQIYKDEICDSVASQ